MVHEHNGHCCESAAQPVAQQHIHRIGQLCCSGHCSHPEHRVIDMHAQTQLIQRLEHDKATESKSTTTTKKSKRTASKQLTRSMFANLFTTT